MTRGRGSALGAHPEGVVITQMQYYLRSRERERERERELRARAEMAWNSRPATVMTGFADWGSSCLSSPHRQVQAYITIRDPEEALFPLG